MVFEDLMLILALMCLVVIPVLWGAALCRLLFKPALNKCGLESIALYFTVGMLGWTWLCVPAFIGGYHFNFVFIAYVISGGIFASLINYSDLHRKVVISMTRYLLTFLSGIAYFIYCTYVIGTTDELVADTTEHIGYIQRILRIGTLENETFRLTSSIETSLLLANYAYTSVYAWFAAIIDLFEVDPILFYLKANSALFVIYLLSYVYLLRAFCGSKTPFYALVVLTLVYLSFFSGLNRGFAYPNAIGWSMFICFCSVSIQSLLVAEKAKSIRQKELFLLAVLYAGMLSIHSQWWLFFFFFGFAIFIVSLFLEDKLVRIFTIVKLGLTLVLASIPFIFLKLQNYQIMSDELGNVLLSRYKGQLYEWNNMLAFKPEAVFSHDWLITFAALFSILLFVMIFFRKLVVRRVLILLLFFGGVLLTGSMLLFVPPIFELTYQLFSINIIHRISGYFIRFFFYVSCISLILLFIEFMINRISNRFHQNALTVRHGVFITLTLVAVTVGAQAKYWQDSGFSFERSKKLDELHAKIYGPSIHQIVGSNLSSILEKIDSDKNVLSDISELISLFGLKVVWPLQSQTEEEKSVINELSVVFSADPNILEIESVLKKYEVDYLLVSPKNELLSWMIYDRISALGPVERIEFDKGEFLGNQWSLYQVNDGVGIDLSEQDMVSEPLLEGLGSVNVVLQEHLSYTANIERNGWGPANNLIDGKWNNTSFSSLWSLKTMGWFYLEFQVDHTQDFDFIEVINNHFTSSYSIKELRMFCLSDDGYWDGIGSYKVTKNYRGVRYYLFEAKPTCHRARLAVKGKGNITLGEVRFVKSN